MKRYCLYTILSLSLVLNAAVGVTAGYRLFVSSDNEYEKKYLSDELELNEDQKREWRKYSNEFTRAMERHWKQAHQHREAMIREIFKEEPDPDLIENERQAILALQDKMQKLSIKHMQEEKAMLTPPQQKKLAELLIKHTVHPVPGVPHDSGARP